MASSTAIRAVRLFGSLHSSVSRSIKSTGSEAGNPMKQAFTVENFPRFLTLVSVAGVVAGYALMENIQKTAEREHLEKYMMDNNLQHAAGAVSSLHLQRRFTIGVAGPPPLHHHHRRTAPSSVIDIDARQSSLWTHAE